MFRGLRSIYLTACLISPCYTSTAQDQPTQAATDTTTQEQNTDTSSAVEIHNRMNMEEPMRGGMMKKGMKKGDVAKSAEKKDEEMKNALKIEEKSMPPMLPQEPNM